MEIKNIKSPTDLSGLYVIYKGSTTIEDEKTYGLSHFLEHLVCKQVDHLLEDFNKYSINFNAFTDNNYVVYYITGLDEYVDKFSEEFLYQITSKINLTDEDFEVERKIIIEEYNRSFTSSDEGFSLNIARKNFNYYGPIGEIGVIKNTTKENILALYNKQYSCPYMIVNVSKEHEILEFDNDFKYNPINIKFEPKVNFPFSDYDCDLKHAVYHKNDNPHAPYIPLQIIPPNSGYIFQDYSRAIESVNIYNHSSVFIDELEIIYSKFINRMLADGLSSPLYKIFREKHGLIYNLHLTTNLIGNKYTIDFETQTARDNLGLLNMLFIEVLDNPVKYITIQNFEDTQLKLMVESRINHIEQYDNIGQLFETSLFYGENITNITFEKIMEHYNKYYLNASKMFIFNNN